MPTFAGYFCDSAAHGDYSPTPYVSTEQTYSGNERLQWDAQKAEEQRLRYHPCWGEFQKALLQVDLAQKQGADWDDEPGQPVSDATVKRAKAVLRETALRSVEAGKNWKNPAVSATPEGGIHLSWLVSGNRVVLTVFAPYQDTVCVSKLRGETSRREVLLDFEAVGRVLQVFEASAASSSVGSCW